MSEVQGMRQGKNRVSLPPKDPKNFLTVAQRKQLAQDRQRRLLKEKPLTKDEIPACMSIEHLLTDMEQVFSYHTEPPMSLESPPGSPLFSPDQRLGMTRLPRTKSKPPDKTIKQAINTLCDDVDDFFTKLQSNRGVCPPLPGGYFTEKGEDENKIQAEEAVTSCSKTNDKFVRDHTSLPMNKGQTSLPLNTGRTSLPINTGLPMPTLLRRPRRSVKSELNIRDFLALSTKPDEFAAIEREMKSLQAGVGRDKDRETEPDLKRLSILKLLLLNSELDQTAGGYGLSRPPKRFIRNTSPHKEPTSSRLLNLAEQKGGVKSRKFVSSLLEMLKTTPEQSAWSDHLTLGDASPSKDSQVNARMWPVSAAWKVRSRLSQSRALRACTSMLMNKRVGQAHDGSAVGLEIVGKAM